MQITLSSNVRIETMCNEILVFVFISLNTCACDIVYLLFGQQHTNNDDDNDYWNKVPYIYIH